MKSYNIAVMAGDGIGGEVMEATLRVLKAIESFEDHRFNIFECLVGGAAFDKYGVHLPEESIITAQKCDAILFGSVGGPVEQAHLPKWKDCERNSILSLRKTFNFSTNIRPIHIFSELAKLSPLQMDRISTEQGLVDLVIVRELLGDIYFGDHRQWRDKDGIRYAEDVATYNENQILSVTKAAFELALKRDRRVCLVHKANVLEISRLWQDIVRDYAKSHPEVTLSEMLVDNCAMQLILKPAQFDVLLTSNLFGDILSDLASALPGSLGLTASASLNDQGYGLFEPAGGSAPDIAGQGIANPLAQILSLSLMLEIKFKLKHYAQAIRLACQKTLAQGIMTRDLSTSKYATTREFTDAVIKNLASR